MGDEEEVRLLVASSVDETVLKQNGIPRETRRISGKRKRELTARPVGQLRTLVCRFV